MLIEDTIVPHDIRITSTIKVVMDENKRATITVPDELRLTPQLLQLVNQALQAQGLELKHMNITQKHVEELKDLPNVVLGGAQEKN